MKVRLDKGQATDDLGGRLQASTKAAHRDATYASSSLCPTTPEFENVSLEVTAVSLASSLRKFVSPGRWLAARSGRRPSARSSSRATARAQLLSSRIGNRPVGQPPQAAVDLDLPESRRTRLEGRRPRSERPRGSENLVRSRLRSAVAGRYRTLHYASAILQPPQTTLLSVSLETHLLPPGLGWSA